MPQNVLAETELRHLAAIPYQIISPASNGPIIGIYQDSLLGSYRLTRPNIKFSPRDAMNLLMMFPKVDTKALRDAGKKITSFDILSQILAPITLNYKTNLFNDGEDMATSNNVLEIRNGKFIRGQMEKATLGSTSKGILHRIFNDFGHMACSNFIDDLQNVVMEYMKTSSYSVGVSDLIADTTTQKKIIQAIAKQKLEVQSLIDKVHLGIFENNTAGSNMSEFEVQVNNILNKARDESGRVARDSLSKDNRFLMIVKSGSKGNMLNISQMISGLGQQNVEGKRIPYGFENRTLPHYTKYDDSPTARGFVENSYISGLTAPELFFHAMGGRIGLIDTACKSVTWETPIVIIEDGTPKYTEIGRWIDNHLENNTSEVQHFTERQMELLNLPEGVYIPTTDENGIVSWGAITAVTRHDPGKELYEIKTHGGRSVIVTESKSLLIWNKETKKLVETSTPDIKVGDCVPVTGDLCSPPITLDCVEFGGSCRLQLNEGNGLLVGILLANKDHFDKINAIYTDLCNEEYAEPDNDLKYVSESFRNYVGDRNCIPTTAFIGSNAFIHGLLNGFISTVGHITDKSLVIPCVSSQMATGIAMLCSRIAIYCDIQNTDVIISAGWLTRMCRSIKFDNDDINAFVEIVGSDEITNTYNDVVLDTISEINIIGIDAHPKVYDLTIPSTLNFGLANGLQVRDTAQTGYIQRRLIKGLEDLKVEYDMTVRDNMGRIIQYAYGDDGIDTTRVENQTVPIVGMSIEDIYGHYDLTNTTKDIYTKDANRRMKSQAKETQEACMKYINQMIETRKVVVESVFKNKNEDMVKMPVSFANSISNIQGQLSLNANSIVDITPLEAFRLIEKYYAILNSITMVKPSKLFEVLYYYYLSPKNLLVVKRFHEKALTMLLEMIVLKYKQSIVHPGEMVGVIAGQSIGEPTTQMTLNSVTYETMIVVRDQNKNVETISIGDFTAREKERSLKVDYMENVDTTYAELRDFYEIPSCTEAGEIVWRRIEAVTKHPVVNKDGTNTMLKITTYEQREVVATKAKSFLKLMNGKVVPVDGDSLKVGDYIPVSLMPVEFKETTSLDLRQILSPTEYIYSSEVDKAKSVMSETFWWKNHSGTTFILPYSRSDSLVARLNGKPKKGCATKAGFDSDCVYMKSANPNSYRIPEQVVLNYNFGYLVGAYAAEGCMTRFQMSISNNDEEYFQPILDLCREWNITTKLYRHENKGQEGWTTQDLRIYNTVLCRILDKLCGKMSHNKFVSDIIVFSNTECQRGFLDAYIGGDGTITDTGTINMSSVSKQMLLNVQQMLNCLGVYSHIYKPPKYTSNNRGTLPENIHQSYMLNVSGKENQKLASLLNLKLAYKQEKVSALASYNYRYDIHKNATVIPNEVDGVVVMEERTEDKYKTLLFDKIIGIEEVANTTDYAYDLTVEDTRTFVIYNGLAMMDTFHLAGVSSKSNVTRGVPRIEELLRLTSNPKNPSLTIHLKPLDETDMDKAVKYANMLEYTKLSDLVKSIQICFDPNERSTFLDDDKQLLEQFYAFEDLLTECNGGTQDEQTRNKSKWIIRMEMDAESLLDKNITMDDVHYAIANSAYGENVSCVFSDYNNEKLVFRIRVFDINKKKKIVANTLDQSDEIYALKNMQDVILNNIVLRGLINIDKASPRKLQNMVALEDGKYTRKDVWILDTTGSNLLSVLGLDYIDVARTYSNDVREVYNVLGIEAARQMLFNEITEVMEFSDAYINYHHLSLLCDRMAVNKDMVPIFRSGILNDKIGPIAKATFEVHTEVLLNAAKHAQFDSMRGVSASVMCGQYGKYGTGAFNVVLDMKEMAKLSDAVAKPTANIETMFGSRDKSDGCSANTIRIRNNIANIKTHDATICDDDYDMGL